MLTEMPHYLPDNTQKLHLGINRLKNIPSEHFHRLSDLKILYLNSNDISDIQPNAFASLSNLLILKLSRNKISDISRNAFRNLFQLERLFLDNNRLQTIHPLAFRGFVMLKLLDLSNNRLKHLEPKHFITLIFSDVFEYSSIQYLDISNNQLETFTSQSFAGLNYLKELYIQGNPLECSCQMTWFRTWVYEQLSLKNTEIVKCRSTKSTSRSYERSLKCPVCNFPESLKGQRIDHLDMRNFTCAAPLVDIFSLKHRRLESNIKKSNTHYDWVDDYQLVKGILKDRKAKKIFIQISNANSMTRHSFILACNVTGFPVVDVLYDNEPQELSANLGFTTVQLQQMEFTGRYELTLACDILSSGLLLGDSQPVTIPQKFNTRFGNLEDLETEGFFGELINLENQEIPSPLNSFDSNGMVSTNYKSLVSSIL